MATVSLDIIVVADEVARTILATQALAFNSILLSTDIAFTVPDRNGSPVTETAKLGSDIVALNGLASVIITATHMPSASDILPTSTGTFTSSPRTTTTAAETTVTPGLTIGVTDPSTHLSSPSTVFDTSSAITATGSATMAVDSPNSSPPNATADGSMSAERSTPTSLLAGTATGGFIAGIVIAALVALVMGNRYRKKARNNLAEFVDARQVTPDAIKDKSASSSEHKYTAVATAPVLGVESSDKQQTSKDLPATPASRPTDRRLSAPGLSSDLDGITILSPASSMKRKRLSTSAATTALAGLIGTKNATETEEIMKELRTQVKTLFEQIDMHVDNFYSEKPPNDQLSVASQMRLAVLDTPWLYDSAAGILPVAVNAKPFLKHSLAYLIINRIEYDASRDSGTALLPTALTKLYQQLSHSEYASKEQVQQWRIATVGLLDTAAMHVSEQVRLQVGQLAQTASKALEPWADEQYSLEARSSHLATIMKEAVEVGLAVLGMREEVGWIWEHLEAGEERLFVFPGLLVRNAAVEEATGTPRTKKAGIELVAPVIAHVAFRK